jgi:2-dehydro-3-deoxygluconokinase
MKIACIGEAMVEVALTGPNGAAKVGFAGDVLNTAIYLRRALPAPHEVAFVSMIGLDSLSDQMAAFIAAEGISTAHLARHPTLVPGLYAIATDAAGERSFTYWRDTSAARQMFTDPAALLPLLDFDLVYLSAITLAILPDPARDALFAVLAQVRAKGGRVAFDSNHRPRLWPDLATAQRVVKQAWGGCDVGLPSLDDEMALFGDANAAQVQARLLGWGVRQGALKCAALGPVALGAGWGKDVHFAPAPTVVDTTAAGDSFNGGYLGALVLGATPLDAAKAGHAFARAVVQHRGAIVPRADWEKALAESVGDGR